MSEYKKLEPYITGEIDPAFSIRAKFIFEEMISIRPKTILDIGCGRGFYIKLMSMLDFPQNIYGIDLREEHLVVARKNTANDLRVKLSTGNIYQLPFEDQSIDFIICSEVLEHLDNPSAAINEIKRVLKTDGALVATVPSENFPMFWDPLNAFLMKFFNTHINKDIHWLAGIWADHEKLYNKESFLKLFDNGFKVIKSTSIVQHCFPFTHFFIYGIGKNLVENGFLTSLNRFNFEKPGFLKRSIAKLMALPSTKLDDPANDKKQVIHYVSVKKI